ncbi:hypothetical protein EV589_4793 [Mycobacterium sp. BK558]|nr:hypothetical protein [Mycolicibacterium rufum]RZT14076.1 hypothetical protein EV589_4793 [Mycobacterium sp. BK558]
MTLRGPALALAVATAGAISLTAAPAAADIVGFTSPSGNIGCMLEDDYVRCDIAARNWAPPPRPADCPDVTGYGQGIALQSTGSARFVCAGDTALNSGPALPYGHSRSSAAIDCTSEQSGVRCTNSDGHGFRLSREEYALF